MIIVATLLSRNHLFTLLYSKYLILCDCFCSGLPGGPASWLMGHFLLKNLNLSIFIYLSRAHTVVATKRMPGGYQIQTIEYGKILVMLVYREYYGRVYKV